MDGDQLVIYQALAAFAQIAIVLMAIFAVKSFLGVLDRFGVLANRAGKGLVDRASKKGQEIKGNSAWQRGSDARKHAKKALKDEKFAKNPIRRRIAGGFMPTEAGRRGREAVSLNADRVVRQQEAEEAGIIAEQLRRSGKNSDENLRNIALGRDADGIGHSDAGRRAAMSLLAENGRVAKLREVQKEVNKNGSADDKQRLNEVITANSGKLYGRAPDLNPGNPAPGAFGDASASDLASWHHSTITEALTAARTNNTLRNELNQAYQQAMNTPELQGKFTPEALSKLQAEFGAVTPAAGGAAGGGGATGGPGVLNIPHVGPTMPWPPAAGGGGTPPPPGSPTPPGSPPPGGGPTTPPGGGTPPAGP